MNKPKHPKTCDSMQPVLSSFFDLTHSIYPPWEAAGMTAGKPRWICLKWKLVWKKAGKDTHILRLQFNTAAHCVFVSLSPRGIYFDTIRESLHTPRRKRFSRSGPPMAAVTGPWLWVTWKGLQGAGARTPTDTRSEKCLANDENCPTCPLVKVPSSWLNCVRPVVTLGIGRR